MVAAWLSVRHGPTAIADALTWLAGTTGVAAALAAALGGVLRQMWAKAYDIGVRAVRRLLGRSGANGGEGLRRLIANLGDRWIRQITGTLMDKIAAILARGGTLADLVAAITALLEDARKASQIAITEVTRASAQAAEDAYRSLGIHMVRWLTAEDARVCPVCDENEAAGAWPLGRPFPGGAIMPPQHPNCRCALIPA